MKLDSYYILCTDQENLNKFTNPDDNAYDKNLAFKNNTPFVSCISKINNILTDNAEDLDILMPMYNLL